MITRGYVLKIGIAWYEKLSHGFIIRFHMVFRCIV